MRSWRSCIQAAFSLRCFVRQLPVPEPMARALARRITGDDLWLGLDVEVPEHRLQAQHSDGTVDNRL